MSKKKAAPELDLGALAAPLAEQLGCPPDRAALFQEQLDAVNLLAVQGVVSKATARTLRNRLSERITYSLASR